VEKELILQPLESGGIPEVITDSHKLKLKTSPLFQQDCLASFKEEITEVEIFGEYTNCFLAEINFRDFLKRQLYGCLFYLDFFT
jgi:hypothetical protein